jgi:EmrB/QacA subfamily drug resistance transporter
MAQPVASPGPRNTRDHPTAPDDRRWMILAVVAVAQLMVVLDSTIVNIALPSAQRALGFANSDRQWVVTAYALAFGSLLLVGGRLGDMYSRQRILITGLIGFAVASALGGAAVSFAMLVVARALQGAFGAILAPAALGTLVSTFQDPGERRRAFAVFGSVAVGGGAVGLILGGVLTQYLSWRYTLFVNLIFAAVAVAGALVYIRSGRPANPPRMDWPGAVLACAGLFLIVFGFSHAETAGWTAALTLGSLVVGAVLLSAFVVAEQRSSHPLLPLRVILDRTRGGSYVAVGITGIALFGIFLFLTFYLQQVKGYSPVTTGLLFLPLVGGILVASTLYSALPQVGPRPLVTVGMLLGAGGTAYLAQLSVTSSYVGGVLPALVIMGLGFGTIFASAVNSATAGVPYEDSGVASALVNTMQQVGGSIGISVLSTITASATASYLIAHHTGPQAPAIAATHGYTIAFAISAALLGLGAILAILMLPSSTPTPTPTTASTTASTPTPTSEPEPEVPVIPEPEQAAGESAVVPRQQVASALNPAVKVMPVGLLCCSPVIDAGLPPAEARPSS